MPNRFWREMLPEEEAIRASWEQDRWPDKNTPFVSEFEASAAFAFSNYGEVSMRTADINSVC